MLLWFLLQLLRCGGGVDVVDAVLKSGLYRRVKQLSTHKDVSVLFIKAYFVRKLLQD